ncbi:MAG: BREX system P-loop protein BrxC, partial [Candidatus Aenigmatarchaeota archaeon]
MKIRNIFKQDITRNINGIIKVEDRKVKEVAQELSEYVLTDELEKQYENFFEKYYETFGQETQDIGVWVSGFFGSGKSQLVKNLGYLLENKELGQKFSSERFLEKVEDSFLEANIRKTVKDINTQVLMFDIKSQEDQLHSGKSNKGTTITEIVFRKINEQQGYSKIPWIALLERELKERNKFDEFKSCIKGISDKEWKDQRNNTLSVAGNIKKALVEIDVEDNKEDAKDTIDGFKNDRSLTPEDLAEIITNRVESSDQDRFTLIMDEVGQYVGADDDKLQELQSIVEQFGEKGNGNIWIIVTAQSKLSDIISGVKRKKDIFKKISDRFETKINLDSTNIRKVVNERILDKKVEAQKELDGLYSEKSGTLRNKFRIEADRHLEKLDQDSFSITYPFLPYQLDLIPEILGNIRSSGGISTTAKQITGRERNMIKIVQNSIQENLLEEDISSTITLDIIFDQIKTDLPDEVVRRIEDVELEKKTEEGKKVLKVLYLLQQLQWVPNTKENVTVALMSNIDDNKREQQGEIKKVLSELESAKYIEKQTGEYRYLTPTEMDIVDQLESINIRSGEIRRKAKEYVKQVMDLAQVSYKGSVFKFDLNADGENLKSGGNTSEIILEAITPIEQSFSENELTHYEESSVTEEKKIYWISENNEELIDLIKQYLRLEKLLAEKNRSEELSRDAREAIRRKKEQKNEKHQEIIDTLKESFLNGTFLYQGERSEVIGQKPQKAFQNYMNDVINDIYSKFNIGQARVSNKDIENILKEGKLPDVCSKLDLLNQKGEINPNSVAIRELLDFIERNSARQLMGKEVLEHLQMIPYGWDKNVIQFLTAVALRANLIQIRYQEETYVDYTNKNLRNIVPNSRNFKKCEIDDFKDIDQETLHEAKEIIDDIWDQRVSQSLTEILEILREKRNGLYTKIKEVNKTVDHIDLPIKDEIKEIKETLENTIDEEEGPDLIKTLVDNKEKISRVNSNLTKYYNFSE